MNAGISGQHPGKVCLFRISECGEPIVEAVLTPEQARYLAEGLVLMARCAEAEGDTEPTH